jgi:hypothetical protein
VLGVVEDCPESLSALEGPSELAGDVLSLVRLSLLGPDAEDTVLVSEGGAEPELPPLDGSAELAADETPLADDVGLSDDGGLSPLETWLEGADEISECGDDDIPDGDTEDGCELPEDAGDGELES